MESINTGSPLHIQQVDDKTIVSKTIEMNGKNVKISRTFSSDSSRKMSTEEIEQKMLETEMRMRELANAYNLTKQGGKITLQNGNITRYSANGKPKGSPVSLTKSLEERRAKLENKQSAYYASALKGVSSEEDLDEAKKKEVNEKMAKFQEKIAKTNDLAINVRSSPLWHPKSEEENVASHTDKPVFTKDKIGVEDRGDAEEIKFEEEKEVEVDVDKKRDTELHMKSKEAEDKEFDEAFERLNQIVKDYEESVKEDTAAPEQKETV